MNTNTLQKDFIKYTLLSTLGMIGISGYILADTFFVSKGLGTRGLAALNLAIPVYNFIHGTGLMLGMGGATKFSIYKGQKNKDRSNLIFTNTLYLAVIFSILFMLTGLCLSETLSRLLGADESIFAMTNIYLKVLLLFSPAFLMNDVLICFVRNDADPQLSMTAMIAGSLMNIVLDYIFIFPLNMGIFGAVLATGSAPVLSIAILSLHFLHGKNSFRPVKAPLLTQMVKWNFSLGFPSLIAQLSSGLVMILFNIIILGLEGNVGVAAYGVIANLSLVAIAIFSGIEQGVQPLLSLSHGNGNRAAVKKLLRYALLTSLVLSGIIYGLILPFAHPIAAVFNSEQNTQLQEIAVSGLRLYFTALPFVGCNVVLSVYFTSTETALPAHMISLARGLILIIPMAFLLSGLLGMTGVWLAYPVTEGIVALLGLWMYQRLTRRRTTS